jgi:nucleoside-diphosphate-sugar epimerase
LAKVILQKQSTPIIGQGMARWNNVHVADLSDMFRLLVNKGVAKDTDNETWGPKGYMFAESGEHTWGDLSRAIAKEAVRSGYISEPKEYELGKDEALELAGFEAVSWGLNSRGKAERAKKVLDWKPTRPAIEDQIPLILKEEKERLSRA